MFTFHTIPGGELLLPAICSGVVAQLLTTPPQLAPVCVVPSTSITQLYVDPPTKLPVTFPLYTAGDVILNSAHAPFPETLSANAEPVMENRTIAKNAHGKPRQRKHMIAFIYCLQKTSE